MSLDGRLRPTGLSRRSGYRLPLDAPLVHAQVFLPTGTLRAGGQLHRASQDAAVVVRQGASDSARFRDYDHRQQHSGTTTRGPRTVVSNLGATDPQPDASLYVAMYEAGVDEGRVRFDSRGLEHPRVALGTVSDVPPDGRVRPALREEGFET